MSQQSVKTAKLDSFVAGATVAAVAYFTGSVTSAIAMMMFNAAVAFIGLLRQSRDASRGA